MCFRDHNRDTETISHNQLVTIWHSNGQERECYLGLLDTGTSGNFICRSVVQELELGIIDRGTTNVTAFDHTFTVNERVQPKWQFKKYPRPNPHEDFEFFVVPRIPDNIDIVLGNVARLTLGITLSASSNALVAHAYCGG